MKRRRQPLRRKSTASTFHSVAVGEVAKKILQLLVNNLVKVATAPKLLLLPPAVTDSCQQQLHHWAG